MAAGPKTKWDENDLYRRIKSPSYLKIASFFPRIFCVTWHSFVSRFVFDHLKHFMNLCSQSKLRNLVARERKTDGWTDKWLSLYLYNAEWWTTNYTCRHISQIISHPVHSKQRRPCIAITSLLCGHYHLTSKINERHYLLNNGRRGPRTMRDINVIGCVSIGHIDGCAVTTCGNTGCGNIW